jgi:signal transduction histidine kinase
VATVSKNQDDHATPGETEKTKPVPADGSGPSRAGYADFFSRVAHDLRSPLGIVMHVMQRFEADLEPTLNDEQRSLMRLGGRSVRRLRDFVERMTLLAALEADELEPSLQTVDLAELARKGVTTSREAEPRSGIELSVEVPEGSFEVSGDPTLTAAIISELLRNAVAHARRAVRVGLSTEAGRASLFVEDDGAGMSEAAIATLFGRFGTRQPRGGLGVGLSMSRDFATAMAGDLRVEKSQLPAGRPGTVGVRMVLVLPKPG